MLIIGTTTLNAICDFYVLGVALLIANKSILIFIFDAIKANYHKTRNALNMAFIVLFYSFDKI